MTTIRPGPLLAGRWALIGWVIAGILLMHVLSDHGSDEQGMDMAGPVTAVMSQMSMTSSDTAAIPAMAADLVPASTVSVSRAPVPPAHPAPMDTCILFLVLGVVLMRLLKALFTTPPTSERTSTASLQRTTAPRGPPGLGPPRISLCVLRV